MLRSLLVPAAALLLGSGHIPASAPPLDILTTIHHQEAAGLITPARAWQLRALSLLEPEALPLSLRALPPADLRCQTPLWLELFRHRHLLEARTAAALEARARLDEFRPPASGSFSSETLPITVHYRLESQKSVAQKVLALAEESWHREVEELGFAAPLPDNAGGDTNLDIYLASYAESGGGAYTLPTYVDSSSSDSVRASPAYIVLYEGLEDEVLPVYVSHELNHACQAAMDFEELAWAWEVTAVFIEDETYDEVNDYYWYIPYFQGYPTQNLVYFGSEDPFSIYPYGAGIFLHFLNEALGEKDGRIAAELWESTTQASDTNEPDFLDALDSVARARGWDGIDEAYARFALWRYFVGAHDDGHHFSEGEDWQSSVQINGGWVYSEPRLSLQIDSSDLPRSGTVNAVYDLATAYLLINTDGLHGDKQLRITLEADTDARLSLIGSRLRAGQASEDELLVDEPGEGEVSGVIQVEDAGQVMIGLLNMGRTTYDADYVAQGASLSYQIEIEASGSGGCGGCDSRSDRRTGPAGLLLVVSTGWVLRRRRGTPRRENGRSTR